MTRFCTLAWMVVLAAVAWPPAQASEGTARKIVSLDGTWQVAEGKMDQIPQAFERQAPVPGLVDMAQPAFAEVGVEAGKARREAFWYRRTFQVEGPIPEVARLKIHKARYGARVFLNGQLAGEHLPSYTPAVMDVAKLLKGEGQTNELVVRVGGFRDATPKTMPDGWDFEKIRYIPGIFDSVELILTGAPYVVRVQAVPDLKKQAVRVVALVRGGTREATASLVCRVKEAAGAEARSEPLHFLPGEEQTVDLTIPIAGCRLWSPEDPFLYTLQADTGSDTYSTRFGMRSFSLDPKTGRAMLNGKPYFLRGSNVCIYRFFEDPSRGDRPWREEWVRRLHRVFKSMHWNALRYCIGFPPEKWYDIADEEGILIQDEFPIWYGGNRWPPELKSDELVKEYTEWMEERWNHPCVVIWDAQNESVTTETGKAIQAVRGLDLSGRPWDNGWSPPQAPGDVYEAHPYAFYHASSRLAMFAKLPGAPGVKGGMGGNVFPNEKHNPVIINEYGWLWLNRDGTPTTLSRKYYDQVLGPDAPPDARRYLYARLLAAKTEFWRCRRQVAGVLHFCGLGYSRPDGQTSDHFVDIEKLTLEPNFQQFVGDAFSPVGLMIDHWDEEAPPRATVPVVVINDLYQPWEGTVQFEVLREGKSLGKQSQPCRVPALGDKTLSFSIDVPSEPGRYRLVAELVGAEGRPVRSLRDFAILTPEERKAREGLSKGKPVKASSVVTVNGESFPAENAVDGDLSTRWSSQFADPQWIAVDLGAATRISRVDLVWEGAYGKAYAIQVSQDGSEWRDVYKTEKGRGGLETIRFPATEARWVRMVGTERGTEYGYSLWEFKVFP